MRAQRDLAPGHVRGEAACAADRLVGVSSTVRRCRWLWLTGASRERDRGVCEAWETYPVGGDKGWQIF